MLDVPTTGTDVPILSTPPNEGGPASALFGKTRRSVLALLYTRPEQALHLRAISRAVGGGLGAVQRELQRLAAAGILLRRVSGQQVYYQANQECPIFSELRDLVIKSVGVADVLRLALEPLADRIQVAFVYGSLARGAVGPASDVDVLIVGRVTFAEAVAALAQPQETLGREVNPAVYPPAEFGRKLLGGNHFLNTVIHEPKVFLIGDEHGLAELAAQRLAG